MWLSPVVGVAIACRRGAASITSRSIWWRKRTHSSVGVAHGGKKLGTIEIGPDHAAGLFEALGGSWGEVRGFAD